VRNNDVMRSLRYALDFSELTMVHLLQLSGHEIARSAVSKLLKKDDEEGFVECSDALLTSFLDGLILDRRGRSESQPASIAKGAPPLTNNLILKKLRIAFELREEDLHDILKLAGYTVSKPELNALFRKPGHKNYRECGDQILRNFLRGFALRHRSPS
jgi:uncharacterized protein YehS (DUF1456 family)